MHVDGEYGGGGDDVSRVGVGGDYMMFVAMAEMIMIMIMMMTKTTTMTMMLMKMMMAMLAGCILMECRRSSTTMYIRVPHHHQTSTAATAAATVTRNCITSDITFVAAPSPLQVLSFLRLHLFIAISRFPHSNRVALPVLKPELLCAALCLLRLRVRKGRDGAQAMVVSLPLLGWEEEDDSCGSSDVCFGDVYR